MSGTLGKRLTLAGLAFLMVITGLAPGGTGVALAATINATWIQTVNTTAPGFTPSAPGPSGIAYRAANNSLLVVDTEVSGTTNIWEYDLDTNTVNYSAVLEIADDVNPQDATGISLAPDGRLFVSSDGATPGIYIFEPDGDGNYGGPQSAVIETEPLVSPDPMFPVPLDTEDPAFDPSNGHLFFLNGVTAQVFELDPVDGEFGNGNDVLVSPIGFAVPDDPVTPSDPFPTDWEGLALDTATGNLLVGARTIGDGDNPVIHEVTKAGVFVQIINVADAELAPPNGGALTEISGLGVQPAGVHPKTYWIADRGLSQDFDIFDGKLHRVYPGALPPETPVAPVLAPITEPVVGNELSAITFDANATDTNFGDVLTYSLQPAVGTFPTGATINASTGVFSWTPTEAQGGNPSSTYEVKVRVTDTIDGTGTDFQDVTINVAEVNQNTNRSPVLNTITNKTVAQGSQLAFTASATDPDGDGFAFSLVSAPAGAAMTAAGNFTWTPNVALGNYPVTVRVTDNGSPALTDQQTFTVSVGAADVNPFIDDDGHIFENAIEWLAGEGITQGCNPPTNNRFCPDDQVTRGQMAAFLVRAQGYTAIASDFFVDDNGSVFENAINRLRTAGVTQGCNPPVNNRFCPADNVTRGQMAAFLVRAFDLPAYNGPDIFVDDNGNVFEGAIERLAQAGITVGCNPPSNDRFCPNQEVTRGQMAAFLKRALGG